MYKKFLSLLFISLLTGILWRVEVDWHGWASINWLTYIHYALPADVLIIFVWVNLHLPPVTVLKRIGLNITALLYTSTAVIILLGSVYYMIPGPVGMIVHIQSDRWLIWFFRYVPYAVFATFPLMLYWILRLFRLYVKPAYAIASTVLFLASFPISIYLLKLFHHKGSADMIHAVKSGFVFPFLVFAAGLLILGIQNKNSR